MTHTLTIYLRTYCHLCEEMLAALSPWQARYGFELEHIDVDEDPQLADKYGLRVPVLVRGGEEICHYHLDEGRLLQSLGQSLERASRGLDLEWIKGPYAICRLDKDAPLPAWAGTSALLSLTRTDQELSVVCLAAEVPNDVQWSGPWDCFRVKGPLDFSLVGIMAGLSQALADARVSLFAISTYDTDYVLIRTDDAKRAVAALIAQGHRFVDPSPSH